MKREGQLEILYRIYEVSEDPIPVDEQPFGLESLSKCFSHEIAMDCMICESRDAFKEVIRDMYGKSIKFAYSRKYPAGTLYCIIIGEHCYNPERYFNKIEYTCAYCGDKVTGYVDSPLRLSDYEIRNDLCGQTHEYENAKFCSYKCKSRFISRERKKCLDDGLVDESFITKDSFSKDGIAGYIYKITKRSTGEFYVGQTIYAPVFRWGQHLKTDRFDISGILDYVFEVIEVVPQDQNILEREKYWIHKCYKEAPEKSLNIACTANIDT